MNTDRSCPFCGGTELKEVCCTCGHKKTTHDKPAHTARPGQRRFMHCTGLDGCGGFFVLPEYFLPKTEQKERYLLHNNNLSDEGYRVFLKSFADTALLHISKLSGRLPDSILDYGCGNGALVDLLASYICSGSLPENTQIRGWDPFFAPDTPFFQYGADAVLCLEVAEHFEKPDEGFAGLARACRPGGYAAVQTLFAPDNVEDFKRWWYKEDKTHVGFYTLKALKTCAVRAGFEYCGTYNNCSILRAAFPR